MAMLSHGDLKNWMENDKLRIFHGSQLGIKGNLKEEGSNGDFSIKFPPLSLTFPYLRMFGGCQISLMDAFDSWIDFRAFFKCL